MRFKTQLGLHTAYTQSINVPVSLLTHYRKLGLDNNMLIYILQIMAAYWRGEEANHSRISALMGISERSLRKYNVTLQEKELANVNGRYMHGNRLENDYDLTPLLDAVALLDHENASQQNNAKQNAYRMVEQLVTSMERGEDVSGLLLSLSKEWRNETLTDYEPTGTQLPVESGTQLPVESGTQLPVESGTQLPVESGTQLPVSIGTQLPVSIGTQLPAMTSSDQPEPSFRLKPEPSFLGNVVVVPPNSLKENNNNINRKLNAVGLENGAARTVIKKAIDLWGEESLAAIEGWIAYATTQDGLRNPAGLIYNRIVKDGVLPPPPISTASAANGDDDDGLDPEPIVMEI